VGIASYLYSAYSSWLK